MEGWVVSMQPVPKAVYCSDFCENANLSAARLKTGISRNDMVYCPTRYTVVVVKCRPYQRHNTGSHTHLNDIVQPPRCTAPRLQAASRPDAMLPGDSRYLPTDSTSLMPTAPQKQQPWPLQKPLSCCTRGDNYVTLLTTVTTTMFEVYLLQQCDVENLRVLANCCVWNYTPVEKHGLPMILAQEFSDIRILVLFLFNTKYTSNMAACYGNDSLLLMYY